MKTTSLFKSTILALMACVGFVACSSDPIDEPITPEEPETYTVKLDFAGEILSVYQEPMATRADSNDLYGIQVYSKAKNAGDDVDWAPYAYGLFDSPSNLSITLKGGLKYKFVATMVKEGKSKLGNYEGYGGYAFSGPFEMSDKTEPLKVMTTFSYQNGEFNAATYYEPDTRYFTDLARSLTTVPPSTIPFDYANLERYYGESEEYTPATNGNATIDMKRVSFGLKFVVEGDLAVQGYYLYFYFYYSINPYAASDAFLIPLTNDNNIIEKAFTFKDVRAAWLNNEYSVTMKGCFVVKDGSYNPVLDLGDNNEVTFTRNKTTVVNLNINWGEVNKGLGLSIANGETGVMPEDTSHEVTFGN